MSDLTGFSDKIIRIYLICASLLLAFYMMTFHTGILLTENHVTERRINIVAPYHVAHTDLSSQGIYTIDPLLTMYGSYQVLPAHIKSKLAPQWTGSRNLILDDDSEFKVYAQHTAQNDANRIVYVVENSNDVEWDDTRFVLTELAMLLFGLVFFFVTSVYMVRAIRNITAPFLQIVNQLEEDSLDDFSAITTSGEKTRELLRILVAVNMYRQRLAAHISREQSFTRYVSHELRNPMMVIQGALGQLRRNEHLEQNASIAKIGKATDEMQELTTTFLTLARDTISYQETVLIDHDFMSQQAHFMEDIAETNQVSFTWQLNGVFSLKCHPQLLKAVLQNLLKNAFSNSVGGEVTLLLTRQRIDVVDNGRGLHASPQYYEGFGVGLLLVEDICTRYQWKFSLTENEERGCTATVLL